MLTSENNSITFFAYTNYRNEKRYFGIRKADRRHHVYILGKTGMGKTTLIEKMIQSDMEQGNGFAVFDPHGDLTQRVLSKLPEKRKKDCIIFDPSKSEYERPFNLLWFSNPDEMHLVCSGLISLFKKIFTDFWGPRLEHILRNSLLTLLQYPYSTLLDVSTLLTDSVFRRKVLKNIYDPTLLQFWEKEFDRYQSRFQMEAISPILNKIGQFSANPIVRRIVGQKDDKIQVEEIMENKKIFIAQLVKGQIGEDAMTVLGTALLIKFQLAALNRSRMAEEKRQDFYLYVDEFHEFATESFAQMLPEARKYRLNLVLAHQYLDQLSENIRNSVLGNVGSLIVFRTGSKDAKIIVEEFFPKFRQEDFINLPQFHIYVKLLINGVGSNGFSATLL